MFRRFRQRGYPASVLKAVETMVLSLKRPSLPTNKRRDVGKINPIRMIMTFSTESHTVRRVLNKLWHMIKADPVIGVHVTSHPLVTYRKARSLKDMLVRSYLGTGVNEGGLQNQKGFYKCGKCKACMNSKNRKTFPLPTGMPREIKKFINCNSDYCVYVIVNPCNLLYVGSMIFPIKKRILEHQRAIRNGDLSYST